MKIPKAILTQALEILADKNTRAGKAATNKTIAEFYAKDAAEADTIRNWIETTYGQEIELAPPVLKQR